MVMLIKDIFFNYSTQEGDCYFSKWVSPSAKPILRERFFALRAANFFEDIFCRRRTVFEMFLFARGGQLMFYFLSSWF